MVDPAADVVRDFDPLENCLVSVSDGEKTGLWLVGAFGGVATTMAVGVAALQKQLTGPTALATMLPQFSHLPFPSFDEIVIGGHDVRRSSLVESAAELHRNSNVFTADMLREGEEVLSAWSKNIRPGIVAHSGKPVEAFADWKTPGHDKTGAELVSHLADDLKDFARDHRLSHVVVVNVSSSEPMSMLGPEHRDWSSLAPTLRQPTGRLPASSLYGLAAAEAGASYINFTPSIGLDSPALMERADASGISYMGRDGKTGETLMKAVLAPMFVRRHLHVLSWVGHNILGNRDGQVLQDPISKQGKIESKGHLIGQILGYEPQTLVTIEHIASMGDWKTAWDHIHFEGFLGTKMSLQFIWQGCDSLLAAPLALDLVRWSVLARRRGEKGCMSHLAAYFKSPMKVAEQDFFAQWNALESYAQAGR